MALEGIDQDGRTQRPAIRIRAVVAGLRGDLGQDGRIQRVCRRGNQYFVAFVDERIESQLDAFRRARRDEHAVR